MQLVGLIMNRRIYKMIIGYRYGYFMYRHYLYYKAKAHESNLANCNKV